MTPPCCSLPKGGGTERDDAAMLLGTTAEGPSAAMLHSDEGVAQRTESFLIEIRFIKFNLTSIAYQTKSSPLEGLARPRALPRPPPYGAVERSARAWSPALQTGPVLILQFHPSESPRPRGRKGFLVHVLEVLDDDLGVEFGRHHCNVRSYFAH